MTGLATLEEVENYYSLQDVENMLAAYDAVEAAKARIAARATKG